MHVVQAAVDGYPLARRRPDVHEDVVVVERGLGAGGAGGLWEE